MVYRNAMHMFSVSEWSSNNQSKNEIAQLPNLRVPLSTVQWVKFLVVQFQLPHTSGLKAQIKILQKRKTVLITIFG